MRPGQVPPESLLGLYLLVGAALMLGFVLGLAVAGR